MGDLAKLKILYNFLWELRGLGIININIQREEGGGRRQVKRSVCEEYYPAT